MSDIDSIDVILLTALQANAKCKLANLAKKVQLSIPAVRERLEKLSKKGVIKGHHTLLNHKQLNLDVTAFVRVGVRGSQNYAKLISMAESMLEIFKLGEFAELIGTGTYGGLGLLKKVFSVLTESIYIYMDDY